MSVSEASRQPTNLKPGAPTRPDGYRLTVSAYDQVASVMLSALMFVAVAVGCLLVLFFSSKVFVRQKAVPVTMAEVSDGAEGGSSYGTGKELDEPGTDTAPEGLVEDTPQTLEAVTTAISSRAAMMDDPALSTDFIASPGRGKGDGTGVGRGRGSGVGDGTGTEKIPRAQRWTIHFEGNNLKTYAKQLDFFGVELAVLGGEDNLVHYAFHLAKPKPDSRAGKPDEESRLYMTWRSGPLQQADKDLLTKAGIPLNGRVVLQFYPAEVEKTLAKLEKAYTGERDINDVRKTTFDVRTKGDGFEFFVAAQQLF